MLCLNFVGRAFALLKKIVKNREIINCVGNLIKCIRPDLLFIDLLYNKLRFLGIIPKIWIMCFLLFVYYLGFLIINVKGTPSTRPGARPSHGCRLVLSWSRM